MNPLFILLATCALCGTSTAHAQECKSIPDPAGRLACYDRAAQPVASSASSRPAMRAAPGSKIDGTGYVDSIAAEDAIMKERLKGICHGC